MWLSYYLGRAVETGTDIRRARKGFPMCWRWYRWVRWWAVAKTNRTVERVADCRFFCGHRWTWTVAAIHFRYFSSFFTSLCAQRQRDACRRVSQLLAPFLVLFARILLPRSDWIVKEISVRYSKKVQSSFSDKKVIFYSKSFSLAWATFRELLLVVLLLHRRRDVGISTLYEFFLQHFFIRRLNFLILIHDFNLKYLHNFFIIHSTTSPSPFSVRGYVSLYVY